MTKSIWTVRIPFFNRISLKVKEVSISTPQINIMFEAPFLFLTIKNRIWPVNHMMTYSSYVKVQVHANVLSSKMYGKCVEKNNKWAMTPQLHVHVFFNIYLKQPFFCSSKEHSNTLVHSCSSRTATSHVCLGVCAKGRISFDCMHFGDTTHHCNPHLLDIYKYCAIQYHLEPPLISANFASLSAIK